MDQHKCYGRCRRCGKEDIKVDKETGEIIHHCIHMLKVKCEYCDASLNSRTIDSHKCSGMLVHSNDIVSLQGRVRRDFRQVGRGFERVGRDFGHVDDDLFNEFEAN